MEHSQRLHFKWHNKETKSNWAPCYWRGKIDGRSFQVASAIYNDGLVFDDGLIVKNKIKNNQKHALMFSFTYFSPKFKQIIPEYSRPFHCARINWMVIAFALASTENNQVRKCIFRWDWAIKITKENTIPNHSIFLTRKHLMRESLLYFQAFKIVGRFQWWSSSC